MSKKKSYTSKNEIERDVFTYVLSKQMIERGILDDDEIEERREIMRSIERKYIGFHEVNKDKEFKVSYGIVRRRNALYKIIVDQMLSEEDQKLLETYVYACIEHEIEPDSVIDVKLNI